MMFVTNIEALRKKYRSNNFISFSVDIDWASEACISEMLDFFALHGIPLTVFCTHPSPVLLAKREDPMIELGIHPNYCEQSSQGSTMEEVTDYCMNLVPNARCVRGHRWFSANDMYDRLVARGICFDSNECTMMDLAEPYIHRSGMLRFPVFFEDGGFLWSGANPNFPENGQKYFSGNGLKVLDLHPIHFALNSPSLQYYHHVRDTLSPDKYTAMTEETAMRLRYKGRGIRDYVTELVHYIKAKQIQVVSLGQVYDELEYYGEARKGA